MESEDSTMVSRQQNPSKIESDDSTIAHRQQMAGAIAIAANKVPKRPKEETPSETFQRIRAQKEDKQNKGIKRAAKVLLKKKKMKKMTSYFNKS
jgi:hypothetical protein